MRVGSVFSYNGGVTFPIKETNNRLALTGEIKGFNHARNRKNGEDISSSADELYLAPGALWNFNQRLQFSGSLLIGLTTDSSDVGMNLEVRF